MGYIMITQWANHWDQKHGKETSYGVSMLRSGIKFSTLKENTPTLFIKINKDTKEIERAWKGYVFNFREDKTKDNKDKICFTVHIDNAVDCPPKYKALKEGWHHDNGISEEPVNKNSIKKYEPPFISELTSNNWIDFEDNIYRLLKLIGINNIYNMTGIIKEEGRMDFSR